MKTRLFSLRTIFSISLITTVLCITGCGQTGDLYLPEDAQKTDKAK